MISFSSYVHSLIPALKHASKNKILVKTFVLMSHLLTSREIIFKLCSKERYLEREQTSEEEWNFTTWKVHYEQLYQLCNLVPKFHLLNHVMKITFWIALRMNWDSLSIVAIAGKFVPCYFAWRGISAESACPFLNKWALLNLNLK